MLEMPAQTTIRLPSDADLEEFTLNRHNNRDLVACQIGLDGWQAFERPLPDCIFKVCRASPGLVIDVGANTGFYSLLAASASLQVKVLAFEPVASIVTMLDENIRQNKLEDRIRPITCALSSSNGYSNLYIPTQEHGLVETSASLEASFKSSHSSNSPVLVRTLDRAMLRLAPFVRHVPLIKVDVEGHEASVLAGAKWTIRRYRPVIFIEILPSADVDSLNRLIKRNRYRDVRLMADAPPVIGSDVVYDSESWNHAFVPEERLSWFLDL